MRDKPQVQSLNTQLISRLRAALDVHRVHTASADIDLYKRDASNIEGRAGVVCFPLTTAEVQSVISICAEFQQPFVARGSGTGLSGGATPLDGAVVISTAKMNRLISVEQTFTVVVVSFMVALTERAEMSTEDTEPNAPSCSVSSGSVLRALVCSIQW